MRARTKSRRREREKGSHAKPRDLYGPRWLVGSLFQHCSVSHITLCSLLHRYYIQCLYIYQCRCNILRFSSYCLFLTDPRPNFVLPKSIFSDKDGTKYQKQEQVVKLDPKRAQKTMTMKMRGPDKYTLQLSLRTHSQVLQIQVSCRKR